MDKNRVFTPFVANLQAIIDADPLYGHSTNAWCKAKGLPQSTVSRWLAGTHDASLEQVERVAEATGFQPWQLLHPDFHPKRTPPLLDPEVARVAKIFSALEGKERRHARASMELYDPQSATMADLAPGEPDEADLGEPAAAPAPAKAPDISLQDAALPRSTPKRPTRA